MLVVFSSCSKQPTDDNEIKIFLASDHGGYEVKEAVKNINFDTINGKKVKVIDFGTDSKENRVDYPVYAKKALKELEKYIPSEKDAEQQNFGILVCTSGFGMCMVANKEDKVRGARCSSVEEAKMTREHNNTNVLCIGQKFVDPAIIEEMVKTFISTAFEGGRHADRIKMY